MLAAGNYLPRTCNRVAVHNINIVSVYLWQTYIHLLKIIWIQFKCLMLNAYQIQDYKPYTLKSFQQNIKCLHFWIEFIWILCPCSLIIIMYLFVGVLYSLLGKDEYEKRRKKNENNLICIQWINLSVIRILFHYFSTEHLDNFRLVHWHISHFIHLIQTIFVIIRISTCFIQSLSF